MKNKWKIELTFEDKEVGTIMNNIIKSLVRTGGVKCKISEIKEVNLHGAPVMRHLVLGKVSSKEEDDYHNHVPHYPAPTESEIDGD